MWDNQKRARFEELREPCRQLNVVEQTELAALVKELDKRPPFLSAEMLAETLFLLLEGASAAGSFQKRKDAHIQAKKIAMTLLAQQ